MKKKAFSGQQGEEKMAVPKRKTSKMKIRSRKAANRYEGVQATFCQNCGAAVTPHRACLKCGTYKGQSVVEAAE